METKVFNLIILDESGSMECIKKQALDGLNETLQSIRQSQEKHPELTQVVSIVPFEGHNVRLLRDKEAIGQVKNLTPDEYNPGSLTPLYDAIGFGVSSIRLNVKETDSVLVTIITDGCENSSREYTSPMIAKMISELKSKGWMFTYIGANQDSVEVAKTMNITNAMNFVQDEKGVEDMFRKEHASRSRFMEFQAAYCCLDAPTAMKNKCDLAKNSDFFSNLGE